MMTNLGTKEHEAMKTLCEEYLANNYIDPETSERLGVKRGLRNPDGTGVLAGLTMSVTLWATAKTRKAISSRFPAG